MNNTSMCILMSLMLFAIVILIWRLIVDIRLSKKIDIEERLGGRAVDEGTGAVIDEDGLDRFNEALSVIGYSPILLGAIVFVASFLVVFMIVAKVFG